MPDGCGTSWALLPHEILIYDDLFIARLSLTASAVGQDAACLRYSQDQQVLCPITDTLSSANRRITIKQQKQTSTYYLTYPISCDVQLMWFGKENKSSHIPFRISVTHETLTRVLGHLLSSLVSFMSTLHLFGLAQLGWKPI